jgi:hypothetical protein
MKAIAVLCAALVHFAAASPAEATLSHPNRVVAGVWRLPFFYLPEEPIPLPASIRCVAGSVTAEVPLDSLPRLGGGPRYGAFVEEPLLAAKPGTKVRVEVLLGDSVVESASISVEARPSAARIVSIDEEGGIALWAEDGAGGLEPLERALAPSVVREVLLLRTRDGDPRIVGATDGGEAIVWRCDGPLREIARRPLGGRPSSAAAGSNPGEGFFGLLDGRIVRIALHGTAEPEVVASADGIPTSLALGDADGDGIEDLTATVLEVERSNLVVWRGREGGGFDRERPSVILLPGTGRAVLFASLDREPELLLLLHAADVDLSGVLVWSLSGQDSVRVLDLPGISEKSVHRLVSGDWNGDGIGDLAVLTGGARSLLEFFLMNEDGSAGRPVCAIPVSGPEVDLLAVDLDGSGAEDLIAVEGAFRVWLSDGAGRMAALPSMPEGTPSRAARLGAP